MISKILVIADQDPDSIVTLQKAAELVGDSPTHITVLAFIDSDSDPQKWNRLAALETACRNLLKNQENLILDAIATADIASYCADYCRRHGIDLVIKAGHRSESLFYTPLDWRLIRTLPCPLIVAVPRKLSGTGNVLVALDIQSHDPAQQQLDRKVMKWAGQWATWKGFSLHVACCVEASDPLTHADMDLLIDLENKMRPRLEPEIRRLLDEFSLTARGILIGAGSPEIVLSRLAQELHADLVVMGYTSRHGLGELLLGHTAEKVIHRIETNLALVPDRAG